MSENTQVDIRADVLNAIDATVEGLENVQRYGMFPYHEAECEQSVSKAIKILRVIRELVKNEEVCL